MEQFEPNSHKSKTDKALPEKKVEKVVTGIAKTKKKGEINKIADIFISEDIKNVKSYVLLEVLVPAIKKAISDIVTNGIDMVLYGEKSNPSKKSQASKVSYRSYYDQQKDYSRPSARTTVGYSYDEIVLESRGEAEEVLSRMDELISVYGLVSVADLYDLVGITGGKYTDNKYGWTDIRSANVTRVSDGYIIKLPRATPLN